MTRPANADADFMRISISEDLSDQLNMMLSKISGESFSLLASRSLFPSLYESLTRELVAAASLTSDELADTSMNDDASPLLRALVALYTSINEGRRQAGEAALRILTSYHRLTVLGRSLNAVVEELPLVRNPKSGVLSNVTVAVKDLIAIEGSVRGNGNPNDMRNCVAEETDAPMIAKLRGAGAEIVATTALLEYAAGAQHPNLGEARNPLDPTRTAGGSSGGSAAIIGAEICDLAVGTDTGGSIRIPAAYCGAIGFKPSLGLVSNEGITALSPTLDHAGFLASKIDLIENAMSCVADNWRKHSTLQTFVLGMPRAWVEDPRVDPTIYRRFMAAITILRNEGIAIVDIDCDLFEEFRVLFIDILLFEAWKIYGDRVEKNPNHFGSETLRLFQSAQSVSKDRYESAIQRRIELLPLVDRLMISIDALIMPTVPYFAPETTPTLDSELGAYEGLFTEVFNVTGQPAITLPVAGDTLYKEDESLLQIAYFISSKIDQAENALRAN
jgi:Asp-tRNA(Asn)/Glu-tRNA(Gln) amidotransferase A subunit family amidase